MNLLDPTERAERGIKLQTELLAAPATKPTTLFDSSWRDYIFAEIWSRQGLDIRSRYLITLAGAATGDTPAEILNGYVRGALTQHHLNLSELREAALHIAIYCNWSRGATLDAAVSRVAETLGLPVADFPPIRAEAWDPQARLQQGAESFKNVMTFSGPPPVAPYFEGGILNFVFGEVWEREGLDQRSRRWLTLVGVADSSADMPIRTHVYGAMASGNASADEMHEFVLQYAVHSGWPKASFVQGVVFEMAEKVKKGLFWDGTPLDEVRDKEAK